MSVEDVLQTIAEKEVKFVDLRFTDTRGKEQHVSVPAKIADEEFFEDGKMFDGSSIAGWKGIQESDMVLMPDPDTAVLDPFTEETTLNLRCNVLDPLTMTGYERCSRSLAGRAMAYMQSTGIADDVYFGPEPRVLRLRLGDLERRHVRRLLPHPFRGGGLEQGPGPRGREHGPSPRREGRLLSGAPRRLHRRLARPNVPCDGGNGTHRRGPPPRGRHRRTVRDRHPVREPHPQGRRAPDPQVLRAERGRWLRQDRDLHAQAAGRRQRQRHALPPVPAEGG